MLDVATLIVGVAILAGIVLAHVRWRGVVQQVTESIHEGIALEVRRQDERIRKRVERSDGQDPDTERTTQTRPMQAGDSWPGG